VVLALSAAQPNIDVTTTRRVIREKGIGKQKVKLRIDLS
jgi:hypothetical protein